MQPRRDPINDAQFAVLQWIGEGCPPGRYPPHDAAHFSSAVALRNRGLIESSGHGRNWSASLTDDGRYYIEHGAYPPSQTDRDDTAPKKQRKPAHEDSAVRHVEAAESSANESPASSGAESQPKSQAHDSAVVTIPSRIQRPHPAIRELMNHRKRLDVPADQVERALRMLHALAREAIRRGWTVTANPSTYEIDQWTGRRHSVSPGPDLFTVDAGAAPAVIRIRMKTKRVPHVPTEQEREESARTRWNSYPAYDYVPTENMVLELREQSRHGSYQYCTFEDTASVRLEAKLPRILEKIAYMTDEKRRIAEERRRERLRQEEQARRREEMRRKADRYQCWLSSLDGLRNDIIRHREFESAVQLLRETVAAQGNEAPDDDGLTEYLDWAETYLRQSDPLRNLSIPTGEPPEISYDEWRRWRETM